MAKARAVTFGGSFLAVVAAVTDSARTLVPAQPVTAAIGALTVAFALGQSLGPVLGGIVADAPAGLRASLALSALARVAAAGALARSGRHSRPLPEVASEPPATGPRPRRRPCASPLIDPLDNAPGRRPRAARLRPVAQGAPDSAA